MLSVLKRDQDALHTTALVVLDGGGKQFLPEAKFICKLLKIGAITVGSGAATW